MGKTEKIAGATGIASICIPVGLEGAGVKFYPIIYWGLLGLGMVCLFYAAWSTLGLSLALPNGFKVLSKTTNNAHQSENDYIDSVIQELRANPDAYRMFVQLFYGSDGFHPGIRSVWNLEAGQLFYARENSHPTADEQKEKQSLTWILKKRLAESSNTREPTEQHWYFATGLGKKVQKRYEARYPSEIRRYRG